MNGFNRSGLRTSGGSGSTDPALGKYYEDKTCVILSIQGRRVDGLEQRLGQQDSANRGILEQLMKIQQDFKVSVKIPVPDICL